MRGLALGACGWCKREGQHGPCPSVQSLGIGDSETGCFLQFFFSLPHDTLIKRGLVLKEKHFVLLSNINNLQKSGLVTLRSSDREAVIVRRRESGARPGWDTFGHYRTRWGGEKRNCSLTAHVLYLWDVPRGFLFCFVWWFKIIFLYKIGYILEYNNIMMTRETTI